MARKTQVQSERPKAGKSAKPRTRKPASSRRPKRSAEPSPRERFAVGMTRWLQKMGYNVGLDVKGFSGESGQKQAEKVLGFLTSILPASGMPAFISEGAGADGLFQALIPLLPHADIVGSKVEQGMAVVPLIVFADALAPDEIGRRFDQYLDLAEPLNEFGPRLNLQSMGQCRLFPLLIYFDPEKFAAARGELLPSGWRPRMWDRLYLRAGFVDVVGRQVAWAELSGLASWGASISEALGFDADIFSFDADDLTAVDALAETAPAPTA